MLKSITGFHLEPTNICTLKCPRCPRTNFLEQFGTQKWTNLNLNLEHLKSFIDIDLTDKKFLLCGNYGDPIYYKDLFNLLEWIKSTGATVSLVTNGSYQNKQWWENLCSLLTIKDNITFSIDGMPDTFTNYRINADWESIKTGIDIVTKSQVNSTWKFIPFSFNEDQIEIAKKYSTELGFDKFNIMHSDRWIKDDHLKPSLNPKKLNPVKWDARHNIEINAECKKLNNSHYISANGFYSPCCYVSDHRFYYKSEFYKNKNLYDISKTTLTQVLSHLDDFYKNLESSKLDYCIFKCQQL